MELISNNKTGRSDTIQNLKDFNKQSISNPTGEKEQILAMGDDKVESSNKNGTLKSKEGSHNETMLEKPETTLNQKIDKEKTVAIIIARMNEQLFKESR